jgi:hypothetical protein
VIVGTALATVFVKVVAAEVTGVGTAWETVLVAVFVTV